jgi:hypothetical protein
MLIELDWQKKDVNKKFVGPDWLNMLVDGDENKVTSFNLTKYDFAATHLDTNGDANIKNSSGRKRI